MDQYLVRRKRVKKPRPQTLNILPFRFKPNYTEDDLDFIRKANGDSDVVFREMRIRHPGMSDRTFYRWLEVIAREK